MYQFLLEIYYIHIISNFYFVAAAQLLIYMGAINILIIFVVVFIKGDFSIWTVGIGLLR